MDAPTLQHVRQPRALDFRLVARRRGEDRLLLFLLLQQPKGGEVSQRGALDERRARERELAAMLATRRVCGWLPLVLVLVLLTLALLALSISRAEQPRSPLRGCLRQPLTLCAGGGGEVLAWLFATRVRVLLRLAGALLVVVAGVAKAGPAP